MRFHLAIVALTGSLFACGGAPAEIDAGEGLIGDGTSVAVDFAAVQARVTGTCAEGAVTGVGADGEVTCSDPLAPADHDHDADYAAAGHDHDADYAAAGHDHDADYAAAGHDHAGEYVSSSAFTGHNNPSCADDRGFLVIANDQEEFGCSVTCGDICARHGMTCDSARTTSGTFRTCTSINNNESLYCWCKS